MRTLFVVLFVLTLSLVSPGLAFGQESAVEQETVTRVEILSASQLEELEDWVNKYEKYQKWYKLYGYRVKFHHKRKRPEPPEWLAADCQNLIGGEGAIVEACALLKKIDEGESLAKIREAIEAHRKLMENQKSRWYERVHFGFLQPIVSDLSQVEYGALFETHVSIRGVKKLSINLPGLMFLSLPDRHGNRTLKRAVHFGASLELKTFKFPGSKQKFAAHLNFSNARVMDQWFSGFAGNEPLSLMGFSFTAKK